MPPASYPAAGRNRKWTDAQKLRVLKFYQKQGHGATLQKYQINSSMLHNWKHKFLNGASPSPKRVSGAQYVLAKKLSAAIRAQLAGDKDLTDVEIYGSLLCREILGK